MIQPTKLRPSVRPLPRLALAAVLLVGARCPAEPLAPAAPAASRPAAPTTAPAAASSPSTSAASPAPAVEFHRRFKPGMTWAFERTSEMRMANRFGADGQVLETGDSQIHLHVHGTVTVTGVGAGADGLITTARVAFDDDCGATFAMNGKPQPMAFAFAGQTINVARGEGSAFTTDYPGKAEPLSLQVVGAFLELDGGLSPGKPVAVGAEWDLSAADVARVLKLGPGDKGAVHCKLTKINAPGPQDAQDVGPMAEVAMTVSATQAPQPGMESRTAMEGVAVVSLETGQVVRQETAGSLAMDGTSVVPGRDRRPARVRATGDGKLSVTQDLRPAATPQAAGPEAWPLAGSYKGEKLALDLRPANAPGAYAGMIHFGPQDFPVRAKAVAADPNGVTAPTTAAAGARIEGTFESQGHRYPFAATLAGPAMTFTTEGTTYTMKRAAAPTSRP